MKHPKFAKRIGILLLFFIFVYVILRLLNIDFTNLSAEQLRAIAHDNFLWLLVIVFLLMFVQNLLNFFPLVLLFSLNVTLFGFWFGLLISVVTSTIACALIFLCIRYFFHDIDYDSKYERYTKKIENHGFWFILIARLIPIMPTTVINVVAAISTIRFIHFFLGTMVGNFLYALFISFVTQQIIT